MGGIRRSVLDFVCAVVIVSVVVFSIAVVTNGAFFENAIVWNGRDNSLVLFGTEFAVNENFFLKTQKLLEFNDLFFGKGFSTAVTTVVSESLHYLGDVFTVMITLARRAVGAE